VTKKVTATAAAKKKKKKTSKQAPVKKGPVKKAAPKKPATRTAKGTSGSGAGSHLSSYASNTRGPTVQVQCGGTKFFDSPSSSSSGSSSVSSTSPPMTVKCGGVWSEEEEKSSGKGKGKAPEIGSDDWNASLTLVMRARAGRMAPMFERLIQNSRLVGDPSPAEIRELVHMMNRTTRVTMGLSEDFEYEESFQESFDEMDIDDKEKEEEEEEGPYYGEGKNPYDSFFGVSHLICPHQHPPTQRIGIANQSEQSMQDSFRKKDSDKKDKDKGPYNSMYGVSHLVHPHQHSLTTGQYR
jgi:hypothetical protein